MYFSTNAIIESIKHKYKLIKYTLVTGDFNPIIAQTKQHVIYNKNSYTVITFLVILYILYENDIYNTNTPNLNQRGGDEKKNIYPNNIPTNKDISNKSTSNKSLNSKNISNSNNTSPNKKTLLDNDNMSGQELTKGATMAKSASGLCDGDNMIAKICRGSKDGVMKYFMLIGYVILAGLAILSPFVIYIILLYMILKIMFTSFKQI